MTRLTLALLAFAFGMGLPLPPHGAARRRAGTLLGVR